MNVFMRSSLALPVHVRHDRNCLVVYSPCQSLAVHSIPIHWEKEEKKPLQRTASDNCSGSATVEHPQRSRSRQLTDLGMIASALACDYIEAFLSLPIVRNLPFQSSTSLTVHPSSLSISHQAATQSAFPSGPVSVASSSGLY